MKRYSLLFPRKENEGIREEMPGILESLGLDSREYQMGKEKVSDLVSLKIKKKIPNFSF